ILCSVCRRAIPPVQAIKHVKTHGMILNDSTKLGFSRFLQEHPAASRTQEICHPGPGGAPVEILEQKADGFCCNLCTYCTVERKTFSNRWYQSHGKDSLIPADQRSHRGMLQTFFAPFGVQYFEVNPSIASLSSDDPFTIYMRDIVPSYKAFPS